MYPLDRSPGAPARFCITRFRATSCLNISTGFTVFPAGGGVISFHRIIQKIDNSYYYIFTRFTLSLLSSLDIEFDRWQQIYYMLVVSYTRILHIYEKSILEHAIEYRNVFINVIIVRHDVGERYFFFNEFINWLSLIL